MTQNKRRVSESVSEWQNVIIKLSQKWYLNMVPNFQQNVIEMFRISAKYYSNISNNNMINNIKADGIFSRFSNSYMKDNDSY